MARMYNFGFMEFDHMLEKLANIPDSTKKNMLKAAADVYEKEVKKTIDTTGLVGYFNPVTGKPGGGGRYDAGIVKRYIEQKQQGNKVLYVTWKKATVHDKGVTAADVAFLTEYGAPGRGIPARPFIARATETGLLDAYDAALDELEKTL